MDSMKTCGCGCGKPTELARETIGWRGWKKGEPLPFRPGHYPGKVQLFSYKVEDCGYETECWVWTGTPNQAGYGRIVVNGKRWLAHRWSWVRHRGTPVPEGLEVCHKCDNPPCIRPEHLFLGTQRENILDMIKKGRGNSARGENSGKTYLTNDEVLSIRKRYAAGGISERGLARELDIPRPTINGILRRRTWKHLD